LSLLVVVVGFWSVLVASAFISEVVTVVFCWIEVVVILVVTEIIFLVVVFLVLSLSLLPLPSPPRVIEKIPEEEPLEAILLAATLKAEINELLDKPYEDATSLTEL